MVVCRKGSSDQEMVWGVGTGQPETRHLKPGEGGPVFLPRRKPSPFTEALLAALPPDQGSRRLSEPVGKGLDRVTAYDDDWFAGRPTI